jgi:23S rRNA (guanosine2251-2'-O)-methyltransferase
LAQFFETGNPERDTELILGINVVRAALEARPADCLELYVSEARRPSSELRGLVTMAKGLGLEPISPDRDFFERLGSRNQGLALLARAKTEPSLHGLLDLCPSPEPGLVLVLDHLEDPHNFGSLIRSAAAFGALGAVYPKDRSVSLTPAARAASAGASEVLPLVKVVNLARALGVIKQRGFWVVAAEAGQGHDAHGFDFPERTALIVGSEGSGLSHGLAAQADMMVHIPIVSTAINSLNVSNAGAILMRDYRISLARLARTKNKASK